MTLPALLLFFFSFNVAAANCLENQAAFDFGSGTVKMLIAEVNVCEKSIVKTLHEERLALALNDNLQASNDQSISEGLAESALPELLSWKKKANEFRVRKTDAVATAVYRKARNGRKILQIFEKNLEIKIRLISQGEEAALGYWAVKSLGLAKNSSVVVWDIGGGSMQFYREAPSGHIQTYNGSLASVSFKNRVLEELFFSTATKRISPNPLGPSNADRAVRMAQNHALLSVPKNFKEKSLLWVGIGGVLGFSVQGQVAPKAEHFSQSDLEKVLAQRALLTDAQLSGDYRATDVTNLALVLGYMKGLKISEVQTRPVSLGQGLIFRNLSPKLQ